MKQSRRKLLKLNKVIERKNWIDAAKAVAILIVVLNHSGLVIPGVNFWGGMFFVPAFFLLSGYTYRVSENAYKVYVSKKAKRLLVPYVLANLLFFGFYFLKNLLTGQLTKTFIVTSLAGIIYGRNQLYANGNPAVYLMINLNAPLWFLLALFLSLVALEGIFRICKKDEKKVLFVIAILCLLAVVYHYVSNLLLPWSLDMLPFFLLMMYAGYKLKTTKFIEGKEVSHVERRKQAVIVLLILLIISGFVNGSFNLSISDCGKSITLMLVSAISSSVILMLFMCYLEKHMQKFVKLLAELGKRTLTILCFHYFVMQWMFAITESFVMKYSLIARIRVVAIVEIIAIVVSIAVSLVIDMAIDMVVSGRKNKKSSTK